MDTLLLLGTYILMIAGLLIYSYFLGAFFTNVGWRFTAKAGEHKAKVVYFAALAPLCLLAHYYMSDFLLYVLAGVLSLDVLVAYAGLIVAAALTLRIIYSDIVLRHRDKKSNKVA